MDLGKYVIRLNFGANINTLACTGLTENGPTDFTVFKNLSSRNLHYRAEDL